MLSDVVADRVRHIRQDREMTRVDLAERCAALGWPAFTEAVLTNIETGRRSPAGVRRREITVDEIVCLAAALAVPPVALIVPVGAASRVEILPGREVSVGEALSWFDGAVPLPDLDIDPGAYGVLSLVRRHEYLIAAVERAAVSVLGVARQLIDSGARVEPTPELQRAVVAGAEADRRHPWVPEIWRTPYPPDPTDLTGDLQAHLSEWGRAVDRLRACRDELTAAEDVVSPGLPRHLAWIDDDRGPVEGATDDAS